MKSFKLSSEYRRGVGDDGSGLADGTAAARAVCTGLDCTG